MTFTNQVYIYIYIYIYIYTMLDRKFLETVKYHKWYYFELSPIFRPSLLAFIRVNVFILCVHVIYAMTGEKEFSRLPRLENHKLLPVISYVMWAQSRNVFVKENIHLYMWVPNCRNVAIENAKYQIGIASWYSQVFFGIYDHSTDITSKQISIKFKINEWRKEGRNE